MFKGFRMPAIAINCNDFSNSDELLKAIFGKPNMLISAEDNIIGQSISLQKVTDNFSLDYFRSIDIIARNISKRLLNHLFFLV